ncbi:unnamed protein product [Taenia asiatica]|uniref:Uncharacterized protein n=1 Tax=Taenia asiatica TaxID=60517 RepID=A0A0R3VUQ4_TAEAS|nr:unnamed protein product [Taenia asiatica]
MRHWRRVYGLEQGISPLQRLSQLAVLQAILQAARTRAHARNRPARVARAHPCVRVRADPYVRTEGIRDWGGQNPRQEGAVAEEEEEQERRRKISYSDGPRNP